MGRMVPSMLASSGPVLLPVELADADDVLPAVAEPDKNTPNCAGTLVPKRLRRLRVVLPKGQIHLEDVEPETLGMLVEALR